MPENMNILTVSSEYSELKRIRDFVRSSAASFGFDEEESNRLMIAVDEVCTNLIKHAFKHDAGHEITLEISAPGNELVITITDDAAPFDMAGVADKNMDEYFGRFTRGGLGVQLVKKIMDSVSYKAAANGKGRNVLTLTKTLHSGIPS